ncbi:MAG: F0F1 ATP synthase subunit B [Pseudomonadota bacterium]
MASTATDAAHGAAEQGTNFPPFDVSTFPSQLLWLAITFGLLYYLMKNVLIPRVGGIIEDRRDRIANDLAEAERLKEETEDAIASYEQALADAKQKAHGIANETRDRINADLETKRAEVDAGLAEKAAAAEARISEMRNAAMAEVDGIAGDTASSIIKQLLGKAPAKGAVDKAVKTALGR